MFYLIFPANKGSDFIKSTAKTTGLCHRQIGSLSFVIEL